MNQLSPFRKKARLIWAYVTGKPIWCTWQVTYACNFRCSFCDYWKEEVNYSPTERARESSLGGFRIAAEKLGTFGSLIISLAGGEPLLRRDLPEIVRIVAEQHIPLITTNGWLVNEHRAKELWDAGLWGASVSLDFASGEAHDACRGIEGAAYRARRAIETLSNTRTRPYQRVNLICVLTGGNLEDIEELLRFAEAHGASVTVQPYAITKTGRPGMEACNPVSGRLLALKSRYRNFRSSPHFLANFDRFYTDHGIAGCKAGHGFFNIDNFLNVQKCVEFREEPIGNLKDLSGTELLNRLRDEYRRNNCRACWYNCRGEVEMLYSASGLLASFGSLLRW